MTVFASANPSPPISRRLRCCVLRRYENVFIELLAEEKNDYPAAHADKDKHVSVSDGGAIGLRPSSLESLQFFFVHEFNEDTWIALAVFVKADNVLLNLAHTTDLKMQVARTFRIVL